MYIAFQGRCRSEIVRMGRVCCWKGESINWLTLFYLSQVVYDLIDFYILYIKYIFLRQSMVNFCTSYHVQFYRTYCILYCILWIWLNTALASKGFFKVTLGLYMLMQVILDLHKLKGDAHWRRIFFVFSSQNSFAQSPILQVSTVRGGA